MKIGKIMTREVVTLTPDSTIREAASLMAQHDIGSLPVCDGKKVLGQVTDRDITIRVTAEGMNPEEVTAADIMSSPAIWAEEDQPVEDAAMLMQKHQIRRLAIVNRQKELVGILALGDLAIEGDDDVSAETLEEVSRPGHHARH